MRHCDHRHTPHSKFNLKDNSTALSLLHSLSRRLVHAHVVIGVQLFDIKQSNQPYESNTYICIYIYKTPYKYTSYHLNQTRGHQEERHNPPHKSRCLFPDLYLIYTTTASIVRNFGRVPFVYTYVCLYIHIYTYVPIQSDISAYRYDMHEFRRH